MIKKLSFHLYLGRAGSIRRQLQWLPPPGTALLFSTVCSNRSFEEFVRTRFNFSSADVSKIFRVVPRLERLQSLRNVEEFMEFFTKLGCNEDEIAKIMVRHPVLLTAKASKLLEPKVQLLKDFGVVGKNLVKLLTQRPRVLSTSLERGLHPRIIFLKNVFQTKHLLVKALVRSPSLLTCDLDKTLKPSLAIWEGTGITAKELASLLLTRPSLLIRSSLTPAKIAYMQKLGVSKDSKMYRHALTVVAASRMETLEEKVQNLLSLGLSAEEASSLFAAAPYIFVLSKEKVRRNMDFVVNTMKLPANAVLKQPYLLSLSLEKRIKPRFLVFEKIKSMNCPQRRRVKTFASIAIMRDEKFVEKFINAHPESALLSEIYATAIADVSSLGRISAKAFAF